MGQWPAPLLPSRFRFEQNRIPTNETAARLSEPFSFRLQRLPVSARVANFFIWLLRCATARLRASCLAYSVFFVALSAAPSNIAEAAGDCVQDRQIGRFYVRAEFPLDRYAAVSRFLDEIAEQEADIVATLGLERSDELIVINLLGDRRSFMEYVARFTPDGARRQALYLRDEDRGTVFAYLNPQVVTDLRHEVTHAVLHSMLPFLPIWLDEGLAEYFELPADERASDNPHARHLKLVARLRVAWRPSLTRLEARRDQSEMKMTDYRESWLWVHFMLHGPEEATKLLRDYLATIQDRTPPGPLSDHLRKLYSSPERQMTQHLLSWD